MHPRPVLTIAASLAALVAGALVPSAAQASPTAVTVVHPGQSIQAALDSASAGATVLLEAGTYYENVTVTKPVTIRGIGQVVLRPSTTINDNLCTEDSDGAPGGGQNNTGFCVLGELGPLDASGTPTVVTPVPDVTIDHLRITGFQGQGVIGFGTDRFVVRRVESDHDGDTGLFFEYGTGTRIADNNVHDNGHAAVRVADSVGTQVLGNRIRSGQQGILDLESTGGVIAGNAITDTCLGIALFDATDPGPTGSMTVANNQVTSNNRFCAAEEGVPSISGVGVALIGATDVTVTRNLIAHNIGQNDPVSGQPAAIGGDGVVLLDATDVSGGNVAARNTITRNVIIGNTPLDVNDASTGINTFDHNWCLTASAPDICH
jgi:hypothetical protein